MTAGLKEQSDAIPRIGSMASFNDIPLPLCGIFTSFRSPLLFFASLRLCVVMPVCLLVTLEIAYVNNATFFYNSVMLWLKYGLTFRFIDNHTTN